MPTDAVKFKQYCGLDMWLS